VSIINDALKKTQQTRKNDKDKRTQVKAPPVKPPQVKPVQEKASKPVSPSTPMDTQKPIPISGKKKSGPEKPPPFVFTFKMASLLTVAALLAVMAITNYQRLVSPSKTHMAAQPIAKTKVVFEGVVLTDNENIAFINKQSLKIGDSVNGMKIVAITQDTVDLQSNQGVLRLKAGATYLL
jgi:hypothetical protein